MTLAFQKISQLNACQNLILWFSYVNLGLVVSTCLGAAFVGSLVSGYILDGVGHRRAFQLCALPMIIGASMRYLHFQSMAVSYMHNCFFQKKNGIMKTLNGLISL